MEMQAKRFFEDLDRCRHGRHTIDPCLECPGGKSAGNQYLHRGQRVGTTVYGDALCVPLSSQIQNPDAWRRTTQIMPTEDQSARFMRREHLQALLGRLMRGALREGEIGLLKAAVEAEIADAEVAYACLRESQRWAESVHTEDGGETFTLPTVDREAGEAGGVVITAAEARVLRDMLTGALEEG